MSEKHASQFGSALRKLRKERNISMVEMVRRTGIARSHLYQIESGEISITEHTITVLADALDLEPEDLYDLAWQTDSTAPGPALHAHLLPSQV